MAAVLVVGYWHIDEQTVRPTSKQILQGQNWKVAPHMSEGSGLKRPRRRPLCNVR